jgi:hypothetical protein
MSALARPALWNAEDCDLDVLSHVPESIAFATAAASLSRQREELAGHAARAEESEALRIEVLREIPDLTPILARLRRDTRPPARGLVNRLAWSLRRALVFLERFAPTSAVHDSVLADRIFDTLVKTTFLLDIAERWRAAGAAARKTG